MNFKLVCAMALGAALLATGPAQAAKCTKDTDCSVGQVCSLGTCKARSSSDTARGTAASSNARIAWGDIGYYNVTVTQTITTPFGTFSGSGSSGAFGINAGTAVNVTSLSADVPLALWGNVAIAFPSGGTFFPLTAGAAVRYDKLPVGLLGGLGLTIMPNSGGGGTTPVGIAFQGMGFLPLPQVSPNFSANLQLSYHLLSSSYSLFAFTVGGSFTY